ncbi:putative reverse transcriptase domain-containing protein, partial [Tanacetum coccineum]
VYLLAWMGWNADIEGRGLGEGVTAVQGVNQYGSNKLKLIPGRVNDKGKQVVDMDPLIEEGHLRRMWREYHLGEVIMNECGLYFFKFKAEEGMQFVLENGPWLVDGKSLFVKKNGKRAWNVEGISRLASMIGNPIIMDRITTSMCEKAYGRASFARVLVEVDAERGLVDSIKACYSSLGRCISRELNDSENKHRDDGKFQRGGVDINTNRSVLNNNVNEWQTVNNRRNMRNENLNGGFNRGGNYVGESSKRGGFGMRGREGRNGRGNRDQRFIRNENVQYIPVKKNNGMQTDKVKVAEQTIRGKTKMDVDVEGIDTSGVAHGIRSRNMFSELSDETQIEERLNWEAVRARIDDICSNNLFVNNEEKNSWPEDLKRDENERIKGLVTKKQLIEVELFFATGQVLTIYELETWTDEMVDYYKEKVGEVAFEKLLEQIKLDGECSIGDEVAEDRSGNAQFIAKHVASNLNDSSKGCRIAVGWDTSVMIVQLLQQTNQIMHFLVMYLKDSRQMHVSMVYGENSPRARLKLWSDLIEINATVGIYPWVMLGDFNVVLKINENTNGMNVRGEGIQEFVECVDKLEMEDINMCGMFYTWIQRRRNPELSILKKLERIMGNNSFISMFPASFAHFMAYLSSDHCPAVLCMPDVTVQKQRSFRFMNFLTKKSGFKEVVNNNWNIDVEGYAMFKLVKRLKSMKKNLRRLNRQNGNVFEKVKFLQTKLARVQECLDKDPSNIILREEEMIYANAYKEAAIDEERLLKQKTKIEISRSRIEGVYDEVFDIDNADNLFTKKLDVDGSLEMIKPVTDDEIKEAIFSIDDNKASGPDGYTLKFFKDF